MSVKLTRDALAAELAQTESLVQSLPARSLTRRSLEARRAKLVAELEQIRVEPINMGSAALFFGGARVQGSQAIDAEFAARGLKSFQDLVAKKAVENMRLPLGERGPVAERDIARLNIVGTAKGSFGFLLEENGANKPQMFPSAVKDALGDAFEIISGFASPNEDDFSELLSSIGPRVLVSVKDFFKALHEAEGTVRVVEGERDASLDRQAVERAYQRAEASRVEVNEEEAVGRLIGLLPVNRIFEFMRDDDHRVLRGKVGPQISSEFLQRIEKYAITLGTRWRARIHIKKIDRSGRSSKIEYTLLDLLEV